MNKYFTDLVDLVGSRPQPFANTKKYISTGALKTDYISEEDIEIVDYISRPSRADLEVKTGDMLFAKMAYTDKRLLVSEKDANHIYSTGFFAIRPKKGIITSKCLYFLLKSVPFKNQKDSNSTGATQKAITIDGLKKIQLRIPEFNKQEDIGLILDNLERIIKYKQQQLLDYDQLIKSRFVEMFGTPLVNEKKWEVLDANDVCTRITDGSHYSPKDIEKGYPMLSVKDMTNGGFIYDECKHCGADDYAKLRKNDCVPQKNDVLIAKDGSYFYYGFVVKEQKEQAVLSSIAILRPDIKVINPEYLKTYMMSTEIVRLVGEQYVTGAALKRVILKGIRKIPVMLPPINMQNQFSDFIEQVDKLKFTVQKSLEETQTLFNSLMQTYFG